LCFEEEQTNPSISGSLVERPRSRMLLIWRVRELEKLRIGSGRRWEARGYGLLRRDSLE
jgi:hypothetical protein